MSGTGGIYLVLLMHTYLVIVGGRGIDEGYAGHLKCCVFLSDGRLPDALFASRTAHTLLVLPP